MPERKQAKDEAVNLMGGGTPWTGNAVSLDPTEDAWERGAPPKSGIYKVDLSEYETILRKYDEADQKSWSYVTNIMGIISEGEYQGMGAFMRVSTYVGKGKRNCTAVGAIQKLGYGAALDKFKDAGGAIKIEPGKLAVFLVKILAKNPMATWELDWRAGYTDKKGKFHLVCGTFEEFPLLDPKDPTKGRNHKLKVTNSEGGSEEINALLNVVHWFGKGEEVKPRAGKVLAASAGVSLEDDLEIGRPVAVVGPVGKGVPRGGDELDLDV